MRQANPKLSLFNVDKTKDPNILLPTSVDVFLIAQYGQSS
jgi:hypothetical protein